MEEENSEEKVVVPMITQIKYEKTSCYFCNEWLDSQTFKEHIIHCGQVLERCPNSCSAYITRKKMRSHLKECPKVVKKSSSSTSVAENEDNKNSPVIMEFENRLLILEQDITALRSVLNEEIKQRLHLITDVGSLRKHNQITDEWTQKVGEVLTTLKKCINEETASRNNFIQKCNEDISNLFYQLRNLQDWKLKTNTQLDQISEKISKHDDEVTNLSKETKEIQSFTEDSVHKIQLETASIQGQISTLSYDVTKMCTRLTDDVIRIQKLVDNNEDFIRSNLCAMENSIKNLNNDFKMKCHSDAEMSSKQMKLDYDVKSMKSIVFETEEKCDKFETNLVNMEKSLHQTNQDISAIEMMLYKRHIFNIENSKGHLIWKITDVVNKFNESRQFEAVLKSPLFTNKQYGYLLRLEVYLNGIGTWKDRNIVACVNVLPGEYDSLLSWPCKLQADIILKDQQYENISEAQDYIKTTVVKRKTEEFRNSNQFIYIPHKLLNTRRYIYNDTMFFEVHVHKLKKYV